MDNQIPSIYIVGPTASGKSELALKLAQKYPSTIISADSMQIYKGLNIGTAKVPVEVRAQYEHKLIDVAEPWEEFSVAKFSNLARKDIEDAKRRGRLPIVVGGTGLYFEALIYPLSFSNAVKDEDLRTKLAEEGEQKGGAYLHKMLEELDPQTAARLHENDIKRVIRALEIVITTGKPMSENCDCRQPEGDFVMIGISFERQKLYERINERVDEMFANGLAQEALSCGNFKWQSMQAIGYKEFKDCKYTQIDGKFVVEDEDEIKELIKRHTRNYAKRQLTWFKRYPFAKWFDGEDLGSAMSFADEVLKERNVFGK